METACLVGRLDIGVSVAVEDFPFVEDHLHIISLGPLHGEARLNPVGDFEDVITRGLAGPAQVGVRASADCNLGGLAPELAQVLCRAL